MYSAPRCAYPLAVKPFYPDTGWEVTIASSFSGQGHTLPGDVNEMELCGGVPVWLMHRAQGSPTAPLTRPNAQIGQKWNSLLHRSAPLLRRAYLPAQADAYLPPCNDLRAMSVRTGEAYALLGRRWLLKGEHPQLSVMHRAHPGFLCRGSTLFRTTMGQMPALNAFSTTNFVCCRGPSLASTNSTAPSTMPSILQRIKTLSKCNPWVSRILHHCNPTKDACSMQ